MPVPDFSPGEVLTAAAMDSIGLWRNTACTVTSVGGTAATASSGVITVGTSNTSVTVSSAFSADYANYRIIINGIDLSVDGESLLLTLSGVTGNVYKRNLQFATYNNAAFTSSGTATAANYLITFGGITNNSFGICDVFNPQAALQTGFVSSGSSETYFTVGGGVCTSTVQSTGFTLSCGSGTMTGGQIRVYGYRN